MIDDADDTDDEAPTFMGWARYRLGVMRAWFASLFRRKRIEPARQSGVLDLASFDAMLKAHYPAHDVNMAAVREHPFLAGVKMKMGPRRWVAPVIATEIIPIVRHVEVTGGMGSVDFPLRRGGPSCCAACGEDWPCPTARHEAEQTPR